ncbi:MAG: hypothetical protein B1H04_04845 [Planctomycetales bacterium 4484_123]|nr:MAG: hypothetical protein B1H04_04845 [Planctomycetales bacterium 4484_123]
MPVFQYRCKKCGHVTAFLEKPGSRGRHECQECGSAATEKVLLTFAAHSAASAGHGACPNGASCPSGTCPLARPQVYSACSMVSRRAIWSATQADRPISGTCPPRMSGMSFLGPAAAPMMSWLCR